MCNPPVQVAGRATRKFELHTERGRRGSKREIGGEQVRAATSNSYLPLEEARTPEMKRPIVKKRKPRLPWTKDDVQMLKTMAREKTKTTVVARKLKRTVGATRQKADTLGVKLAGSKRKRKTSAMAA
jgi:hypothetical protein